MVKEGYASVTLGDVLPKVDKQAKDMGLNNRSLMIRMILKKYYDLKEKGMDLLKYEVEEIVEMIK